MNIKNTTFVITTFRSEKIIFDCLKHLPKNVKKIIVENSKNFSLKKKLEKKFKYLKCYVMKNNIGYGRANNFGIKKTKTKFAFILNPDAKITKKNFFAISKILSKIEFSIAAPITKKDQKNHNFTNNFVDVDYVKGFAMVLNLQKIKNIFFDENIFLYLEEIDLCKRVKSKNGKIVLINVKIDHLAGNSHFDVNDFEMEKSRNWHWMWSKFYFHKKHKNYLYSFLINLPNLSSLLIKYLFYSITLNKKKRIISKMRFLGLFNSYILNNSFYRPYFKKTNISN